MLNGHDPTEQYPILRLYDAFYFKERPFMVSELLLKNLYDFRKFIFLTKQLFTKHPVITLKHTYTHTFFGNMKSFLFLSLSRSPIISLPHTHT